MKPMPFTLQAVTAYQQKAVCQVKRMFGGKLLFEPVPLTLQAATAYQHDIARSLGLPSHKVVCHVKRVGGAFGGKETRFIPITAAAAVAAREIGRPVRIALERQEDMVITGHRHPFLIRYKVSLASSYVASKCIWQVLQILGCN